MGSILAAIGRSDEGLVRSENEDSYSIQVGECNACENLLGWAALADGMGGHAGGGLASSTAVETIAEALSEPGKWPSVSSAMRHAVALANERVFGLAAPGAAKRPGTTLTCLGIDDSSFTLLHVGDSRAYLLRDHKLARLTEDHTRISEELAAGRISQEDADKSALRHMLSRSIGNASTVEPQFVAGEWEQNDLFLLCSDGLTEYVNDFELQQIANRVMDRELLADKLIDTAKQRGGADNVTVVLLECVGQPLLMGLNSNARRQDTGAFELPLGIEAEV